MFRLVTFITISIIAGAVGQLLMKLGMKKLSPMMPTDVIPLAWIVAGIICYLLAMLLWLQVLRKLPLNVAYPLLSLGYIVVYLGAYLLPELSETLTTQKTLGVILIIVGVLVITGKPKGERYE